MNGGIIGGRSRLTSPYRAGVWKPGDSDLSWVGKEFPTSGLVHHWPLTNDANDVVGNLHLTNNNSVTFSAAGALFVAASQQSLTATHSLPNSFAWVCDFNIGSAGRFTLGNANSNILYSLNMVVNEASDDKTVLVGTRTTTALNFTALVHNYRDALPHRLIFNVMADYDSRRIGILYVDNPIPLGAIVHESGLTPSTSFAIGKRGAKNEWFGDGYVKDLMEYDRALLVPEIYRIMSGRS